MNIFIFLIILNYIVGKDMILSKIDFNVNFLLIMGFICFLIFFFDNFRSDVCRKCVDGVVYIRMDGICLVIVL